MPVDIRPIQTHQEYRAVEDLQRAVWNLDDAEIVPDHLLLTAAKNGGLLLGAFQGERLLGFVFGFPGVTAAGQLKHCSHMAGVAPEYQDGGLGYRLKLAQRQHVLAQGIELITWTYDPLESRNAYLNLHKLGATSRTYLRDLYGSMRDSLNAGMPSDRLEVAWHLNSSPVVRRLQGGGTRSLKQRRAAGAVVLVGPEPGAESTDPEPALRRGAPVLFPVPPDIQALKALNLPEALAWRQYLRDLFEGAFGAGYEARDLVLEGGQGYYLLERAQQ